MTSWIRDMVSTIKDTTTQHEIPFDLQQFVELLYGSMWTGLQTSVNKAYRGDWDSLPLATSQYVLGERSEKKCSLRSVVQLVAKENQNDAIFTVDIVVRRKETCLDQYSEPSEA